jgi:hypothetical protein
MLSEEAEEDFGDFDTVIKAGDLLILDPEKGNDCDEKQLMAKFWRMEI